MDRFLKLCLNINTTYRKDNKHNWGNIYYFLGKRYFDIARKLRKVLNSHIQIRV